MIFYLILGMMFKAQMVEKSLVVKQAPNKAQLVQLIKREAIKAKIDSKLAVKIATLESRLNPNAKRINTNSTLDIGLFQINSVNASGKCKKYDINTILGNVRCAMVLIASHKKSAKTDALWYARYHSKTPKFKIRYAQKLASLE